MTESDWIADLDRLRAGGGPTGTYRVKWWTKKILAGSKESLHTIGFLVGAIAAGKFEVDHHLFALYSLQCSRGSLPLVIVPVASDAPVETLWWGQSVTVRGEVAPGRAVMIEADGHEFRPIGPCTVPMVRRRRYRW
jgi:hypothetical protein